VLRVLFFASIRERLACAGTEVPAVAGETVAALVARLEAGPLPGCSRWLAAPNTLVAVNQVLGGQDSAVADGDEVAFYPPVTGG
jgi:molybdopterin synthase sulfur carrier subunit